MEKFIPFEKLSKKKQRELNKEKRGTCGALNPVTRKSENPKAYNRKRHVSGLMMTAMTCFFCGVS